jgi:hypothetical protein
MTPPRKATAVILTINDTTMTTDAPAADIDSEPTAAAGGWLTLALEDQDPDAFEPRSAYVRFEPGPDDLGVSGDPKATWHDPPSHAARAGPGHESECRWPPVPGLVHHRSPSPRERARCLPQGGDPYPDPEGKPPRNQSLSLPFGVFR